MIGWYGRTNGCLPKHIRSFLFRPAGSGVLVLQRRGARLHPMKLIVPLVMTCLVLSAVSGTAEADVAWSNGGVTAVGSNCDFTGGACPGGDTGWTIFDNFDLSNDDTVIALTYVSDFSVGSASDYLSTNWSIWSVDPLGPFNFLGPVASGNSVATLTTNDLSATTYTFTITGLAVVLAPGAYWLGTENVLAGDGAVTLDVMSNGTAVPGYEEQSDDKAYGFTYATGNTAFTIENNPEPASLWLVALAGLAFFIKSRIQPRIKQTPALI